MTHNMFFAGQHHEIAGVVWIAVKPSRRSLTTALLEEALGYDVMLFTVSGLESTEARPLHDGVVDARVAIVEVDVVHRSSLHYGRLFVKRASTFFCAISVIFMLCAPLVFSRLSKQLVDILS